MATQTFSMKRIKQSINRALPKVIEQIGLRINPLLLKIKSEKDQLLIFYFHGIYQSEAEKSLHHVDPQNNVTLAQLEDFIKYFLRRKYQFVRQEDLLNGLEKDRSYVMMTFDDGYYNNSLAVRLLEKYKVPATFFITAGNVLNNESYWWDIIYKHRKKAGKKLTAIRQEQEQLKHLPYTQIQSYIEEHFGAEAVTPWSDVDRPFTPDELQEFAANPYVAIGNHTFNHTILPIYNEEEIRWELTSTNEALTKIIGHTPKGIAFPNGNYDDKVLSIARDLGFHFVFTVRPRKNLLPMLHAGREMVCLDRFMPEPRDIQEYGSFCRVGYHPTVFYKDLKSRLKRLGKASAMMGAIIIEDWSNLIITMSEIYSL